MIQKSLPSYKINIIAYAGIYFSFAIITHISCSYIWCLELKIVKMKRKQVSLLKTKLLVLCNVLYKYITIVCAADTLLLVIYFLITVSLSSQLENVTRALNHVVIYFFWDTQASRQVALKHFFGHTHVWELHLEQKKKDPKQKHGE